MCCDTCNIDGVKLKKADLCEVVVVVSLEMLVCVSISCFQVCVHSLEVVRTHFGNIYLHFLDFSSDLKCTIEG